MTFTTIAAVRSEAWFEGNPSVADDLIESYLTQGHSVVLSYVAGAYNINDFTSSNAEFVDSQAEGLLKRAEELISAWYLLIKLYWNEGQWSDFDGVKKKAEGEKLLIWLTAQKNPLRLISKSGVEFTRVWNATAWSIVSGQSTTSEATFSLGMNF